MQRARTPTRWHATAATSQSHGDNMPPQVGESVWASKLHHGSNLGSPAVWSAMLISLFCALILSTPSLCLSLANASPLASHCTLVDPLTSMSKRWLDLTTASPTRRFQIYYCLFIAVTLCWNHFEGHAKFYSWFYSSGVEPSKKRGLGHGAVKFYGVIPAPKLTPGMHSLAGFVTIVSLCISCGPWAPRICLGIAYVGWFFYYSQLFCATKAGGHGGTTVPGILLMLALSPALNASTANLGDNWALNFIKVQIAATYCGSGMCKLAGSLRFKQCWADGATMQAYVFDAMWSRPGGELTWTLQGLAMRCPRLLVMPSLLSLFFEFCFPLALTSPQAGIAFSALGLVFHAGIYFLQGFDFMSQWCPLFLLFALQPPELASAGAVHASLLQGSAAVTSSILSSPGLSVAFLYTAASMLVSLTMMDLWYGEVLPWSCCPMFLVPRNLFAQAMPRWWSMTGAAEQRQAGFMDPLMNSPANAKFYMPEEDLFKFPHKLLQFGSMSNVPKGLQKFVRKEYLGHPQDEILCFANFTVSAELKEALENMIKLTFSYSEADAWNDDAIKRLIDQQRVCRYHFEKATFKPKTS